MCEPIAILRGINITEPDVEVADEQSGKVIALFRCTQMILYPRA